VLVLDTSGSMAANDCGGGPGSCGNPTGAGPPSCGGLDNKINHAKCAINKIANSYGDMVFALGRFRTTMGGTVTSNNFPATCCEAGPAIGATNGCTAGITCSNLTGTTSGHALEMLSPLIDGANQSAAVWVNSTANTCTAAGTDPEIWDNQQACVGGGGADGTCGGATPLEGVLQGSKRYWQGLQATNGTTIWPAGPAGSGFDPIRFDPTKTSFLPNSCDPNPTTCVTKIGSGDQIAVTAGVVTLTDAAGLFAAADVGRRITITGATNSLNNGTFTITTFVAANQIKYANASAVAQPAYSGGWTLTSCCVEQCRPYVVILLTDGAESCGGDPTLGAAALLQTDIVDAGPPLITRRYRIETKPIGFGIAPGNAQIEAIAHAGGAIDGVGNEGFYALDEASLELAMTSILNDAIKTEVCNNLDDDCDTLIDEDFPGKNGACDNGKLGVCRTTGTLVCRADGTGLVCNAPAGPAPGVEICNNLDDDCDGKIDEGLTGCTCSPQGEACDGIDNDCDGIVDEGITVPCGFGTCQGTKTCIVGGPPPGAFGPCSAQNPTTEVCNGLDDDCDGQRDGFTQGCSTMPPLPPENFPVDDPRNNPGDPSNAPIPQNICHPGNKTCPANIGPPNNFGACIGEQQPKVEICNGLDDDCDNKIDEGTGGADCSSNCGIGTTVCVNGQIQCNSVPATNDDTCDGNDDDCDGQIDEDYVCDNPPNCPCTAAGQCNAVQSCVAGHVVCQGQPVSQESCNCLDDDCNGIVDNGVVCGGGATCTDCQCAFPCGVGEFPCPLGKLCSPSHFCVTDPCFGVACPPVASGNKQVCQVIDQNIQACDPNLATCSTAANCTATNNCCCQACDSNLATCSTAANCRATHNCCCEQCVDACSVTTCAPLICIGPTGECVPDDCRTFPERCQANQNCVVDPNGNGVCVTNLCQGVTCPTDQYCVGGQCFGSCADVDCPTGQRCRLGLCEADPCGHPCPFGKACNDNTGKCVDDSCPMQTCPQGQWCNPNNNGGTCEPDPCVGTMCPNPGEVCRGGSCFNPQDFLPDAGEEVHVTTGGGGGCNTGAGGAGVLIGLALLLLRRRENRGGRS
jgi:hypothetical protein